MDRSDDLGRLDTTIAIGKATKPKMMDRGRFYR